MAPTPKPVAAAAFPTARLRRLRQHPAVRNLVQETRLAASDFILPLFVRPGKNVRAPITSMPGHFQLSVDQLPAELEEAAQLGLGGVILFGIPDKKDALGSDSTSDEGIVQQAIRAAKRAAPDVLLITDVCFCEYTDHGHCGVLDDAGNVINDATLERYRRIALAQAEAGAHLLGPSGMMDGQVAAIRDALDASGHDAVGIVAYAAKFASAFYGPFREAAESEMLGGDRAGHQMDPANRREARRELDLDAAEGADVLMVKPALPYLDVLADARRRHDTPIAAYHVSGEYAMIRAAAERGWLDGEAAMRESVLSILRAGADIVLTYAALELAAD